MYSFIGLGLFFILKPWSSLLSSQYLFYPFLRQADHLISYPLIFFFYHHQAFLSLSSSSFLLNRNLTANWTSQFKIVCQLLSEPETCTAQKGMLNRTPCQTRDLILCLLPLSYLQLSWHRQRNPLAISLVPRAAQPTLEHVSLLSRQENMRDETEASSQILWILHFSSVVSEGAALLSGPSSAT